MIDIKKKIVGFFEEKPGVKSNGRLNSTIIIWSGLLMGFLCIALNRVEFSYLCPAIVTIGFLKKVIQKQIETNEKKNTISDNRDIMP